MAGVSVKITPRKPRLFSEKWDLDAGITDFMNIAKISIWIDIQLTWFAVLESQVLITSLLTLSLKALSNSENNLSERLGSQTRQLVKKLLFRRLVLLDWRTSENMMVHQLKVR